MVLAEITVKSLSVSNGPITPIYALGVHFSYDPVLEIKLNFEEKVYYLEQTLHSWKRRNLTLIGRINIVKTLGLAKLI